MSTPSITPDWDPNLNASVDDRTAQYARLRAQCPVALGNDAWGSARFWGLMRYSDIISAVRDTKAFVNGAQARLGIRRAPLESDPPEHSQIRRLLNPLFSPKAMAAREPFSRTVAAEYLDAFVASGGGDAIAAIARPIPTQVLLGWLGQPREDWVQIKAWADASRPQQIRDDETRERIEIAEKALWDYSWALIRDRQSASRDPASDPVSAILGGTLDGAPMPEEHAVGMVRLVLAAGHDSTSQAIGITLHFLATRLDVQEQLRADRTLVLPACEEILRLNSPVVAMPRTVAHPVELGGRQLCPGDKAMLYWASANRDPEIFEDADTWRLGRAGKPHMVFGSGIHSCAGAPLAKQELVVVVNGLLDRCRAFALAGETTQQPMQQYGFATLPLAVTP